MMAGRKEGPRLFTLEEANRLLPQVKELLQELRAGRDEIQKLEEKKAVEELSWLQPNGSVSPAAAAAVADVDKLLEAAARSFEEILGKLNVLGAQLKDLEEGLVDFFAARGSEVVYLCWREGEREIRFWHDLKSGFSGRKPLEKS